MLLILNFVFTSNKIKKKKVISQKSQFVYKLVMLKCRNSAAEKLD